MSKTFQSLIVLAAFSLLATSCGPGQLFGPTLTPTSTPTLTPTITPSPTIMPSPTSTLTPTAAPSLTPTPSCAVKSGKWVSNEMVNAFLEGPLLTFSVKNCQVTQVQIVSFPAPGELFWMPIDTPIPLQGTTFSYTDTSGMGEYTLEGTFDTESTAHGTLFFPKGFLVVDYTLPNDVTIGWTAHPE
jgi:hypothetical protein